MNRNGKHCKKGKFRYLLGLALLVPLVASAQLFVDPAGIDVGACVDPLNPCQTISYALTQAAAGDDINLAAGVYNETNLNIPFGVNILGANALTTTIDAQAAGRIFSISAGPVFIDRVTLTNGDAGFTNGGAIELTGGDLVVTRSRLLSNEALVGGAIAAASGSGSVNVILSTVRENNGSAGGGGIWCDGCAGVNVAFSNMAYNTAGGLGGAINAFGTAVFTTFSRLAHNNADGGGGIYANFSEVHVLDSELNNNDADALDGGALNIGGDLNIERSALVANIAAVGGGAVYLAGAGGFASANSTYSGNSAMCGGALLLFFNFGPGADVLIGTSTFANNEATFPNCGEHIFGGWNTFGLYNSIVANDPSVGALDPLCSTAMTAGTNNLIDDASCDTGGATFNLGAVVDLDYTLAYNGGLTRTHDILPTSNAVDGGRNPACLNPAYGTPLVVDQRGRPRPIDYNSDGVADCDIGSVELQ